MTKRTTPITGCTTITPYQKTPRTTAWAESSDLGGSTRASTLVHHASRIVIVPHEWHDDGMARTRISTTVDADLLADARRTRSGATDAELIDDALTALLARHRAAEIDEAYAVAYAEHPIDEADEWGDLDSFRSAAATT